jgi:hypothetical protein
VLAERVRSQELRQKAERMAYGSTASIIMDAEQDVDDEGRRGWATERGQVTCILGGGDHFCIFGW